MKEYNISTLKRIVGKSYLRLILIACFIGILVYVSINLFSTSSYGAMDTEPPKFLSISGNLTVTAGGEAVITVDFIDNVNVTKAILFYRSKSENIWRDTSILNGSVTLDIPSSPIEDWYYYVVIDDAAGNGPVGEPSANGSRYYVITVIPSSEEEFVHTVFIEQCSSMSCKACPSVDKIIQELYESGKYRFYYVTLVYENPAAENRMKEYNLLGYPTVYIDGGYNVILGSKDENVYEDKIKSALLRTTPRVLVNVTAELDKNNSKIAINGYVRNGGDETYKGRLKVYLTEYLSTKWQDYDGNPYHFAFLEYALDKHIEVSAGDKYSYSLSLDATKFDPDNLVVFAVVFNDEKQVRYSNPDEGKNPFDAYFADNVAQTSVVEEHNLPPSVGIVNPKRGKLHLFGRTVFKSFSFRNTILVGRATIVVNASDDSSLSKVEFYLDDKLVKTCREKPFEWRWVTPSILKVKHTLKVVAFDDTGKTSTATMDVIAFILL